MRWCGPFPAPPADLGDTRDAGRHPIVMVGLCALMVGEAVWSMRNDLIRRWSTTPWSCCPPSS